MSDLLFYIDEIILRVKSRKGFIYEGDNDISSLKKPEDVIETAKQITTKLLADNPKVKIYYIGVKPSPSRWKFKNEYLKYNTLLKAYCDSNPQLSYIDVWDKMLNKKGLIAMSPFE